LQQLCFIAPYRNLAPPIREKPRMMPRIASALANGARVVSLPGDPDTLRGYSAPKRIIKVPAGRPFICTSRYLI